jgi:hypothetical protein
MIMVAGCTIFHKARIGSRFTGERAVAVARALADARRTIADMPANYVRYEPERGSAPACSISITV